MCLLVVQFPLFSSFESPSVIMSVHIKTLYDDDISIIYDAFVFYMSTTYSLCVRETTTIGGEVGSRGYHPRLCYVRNCYGAVQSRNREEKKEKE